MIRSDDWRRPRPPKYAWPKELQKLIKEVQPLWVEKTTEYVVVTDNIRQQAQRMRDNINKLERKKHRQAPPKPLPQLTNDDEKEYRRLEAQISHLETQQYALQIRAWERELIRLKDIWSSPSSLRHFAAILEAELARRERRGRLFHQSKPDPLSILNLSSNATPDQIRQRYRELVKQLHPDSGNAAGAARYQQVIEAMDRLRAEKRA